MSVLSVLWVILMIGWAAMGVVWAHSAWQFRDWGLPLASIALCVFASSFCGYAAAQT